jgi:hypothetical protein
MVVHPTYLMFMLQVTKNIGTNSLAKPPVFPSLPLESGTDQMSRIISKNQQLAQSKIEIGGIIRKIQDGQKEILDLKDGIHEEVSSFHSNVLQISNFCKTQGANLKIKFRESVDTTIRDLDDELLSQIENFRLSKDNFVASIESIGRKTVEEICRNFEINNISDIVNNLHQNGTNLDYLRFLLNDYNIDLININPQHGLVIGP